MSEINLGINADAIFSLFNVGQTNVKPAQIVNLNSGSLNYNVESTKPKINLWDICKDLRVKE